MEENILEKIENKLSPIRKFFRDLFTGISRVIYFLPVIWRDRDWDFDYFLILMEHKLKSMRKNFSESDFIVPEEYKTILEGINDTLSHIKDYRESTEAYNIECGGPPFDVDFKSKPTDDGLFQLITVHSETGEELTPDEDLEYTNYILEISKFEQEKWEAIWDTIKEEGQRWWD